MPSSPTSFVWYELMTTDMKAAEAFYGAVNGWTAADSGQPDLRYTLMSAGGTRVAGIMELPEMMQAGGGQPRWTGYISTHDVDAATDKVKAAGGRLHHGPADIPEVGRFSVVSDPQGALFQLFTPEGGGGEPAPAGTPGHVGWHELHAADWERAFAFYSDQFGWTKAESVDMGAMGIYQTFAAGRAPIGGMMNMMPGMPSPAWQFYFNVPGIDEGAARVAANGGRVLMGPHQVPGGSWIVTCADPQGAMFALVALSR